MRALIFAIALGATSVAQAQAPAAAAPVAPKKGVGGELRVGGFMVSGDRSYDFSNDVKTGTGSMKGIDVVARIRAIGLQFKSISGEFDAQPNVASADVRLLLFPPVFSIVAGVGRRAIWSKLNEDNPTQFNMILAGISSSATIGGSGLRTNFSAVAIAAQRVATESTETAGGVVKNTSTGLEGEASIMWRIPKAPLYVQLGYRTEVFTAKSENLELPEEVRGIKLGGGFLFGGR